MAVASTDHELREILTQARTIAVVGASADPAKPSHEVAAYLQAQGYRIIPVNPRGGTILGETVYPNLRAVPVPIDLVDVFRPPADCAPIAEEAVAVGAKALWLQLGIANADAARIAEAGGLRVVMNHCTLVEHRRLVAK